MNIITKQRVLAEAKFHRFMAENYIPLNMTAVRILGTDAAVMLAALYEEYTHRKYDGRLEQDSSFRYPVAKAQQVTGLSRIKQTTALKTLEDFGLIVVITTGVPKKRKVKFLFSATNKLMLEKDKLVEKDKKSFEENIKKHNEIQDKIAAWHESHPKTEQMGYVGHGYLGVKEVPHTPEDLPF